VIPDTTTRVAANTAPSVNAEIRRETDERVRRVVAGGERAIRRRLEELDREWDVERTLEANAATLALCGISLGAFVDRRFFALPAAVAGFLLQHAVQGWCPPIPVIRRLGVRTAREIAEERYALKVLRGDFGRARAPDGTEIGRVLETVRA
jgi:hypothetical protein